MKNFQKILVLFLLICSFIKAQDELDVKSVADIIYGEDEKSDCKGDCKYVHKLQAIFPLAAVEDGSADSDLNKFNYKYIYLYDDHLSVFKSKFQAAPPTKIGDEAFKPAQTDFLNNYPMGTFIRPCNNEVCTVGQFKKYMEVVNPGSPFTVNQNVLKALGPVADQQCLVLIQDMLAPETFFYVCTDNLAIFYPFKLHFEEISELIKADESVTKCSWLLPDKKDLELIYIHINSEILIGNNNGKSIREGQESPDYKEYFKYSLDTEFFRPAASNMGKKKIPLLWEGQADKKPDVNRCFQINIKQKIEGGAIDMGHEVFCIYGNADGSKPINVDGARMAVEEWVLKINKIVQQVELKSSQMYLEKCSDDACMKTLTIDNPYMMPICEAIHHQAVKIDKTCKYSIIAGLIQEDVCEKKKQEIVVDRIEEECIYNKGCMQSIAAGVENGEIPLSNDQHKSAWDYDNPYRNIDAANKEAPAPLAQPTKEELQNMNAAQKEIAKIQMEIGMPLEIPPKPVVSSVRPSVLDIQKAIQTFNQVLQGKTVDNVPNLPSVCKQKAAKGPALGRAVGLVPFIARFDPWLEYLGYIRDVQTPSQ